MRDVRLAVCCCLLLAPGLLRSQATARDSLAARDTVPDVRLPALRLRVQADTLLRGGSPALTGFGRLGPVRSADAAAGEARALALRLDAQGRFDAVWGQTVSQSLGAATGGSGGAGASPFAPFVRFDPRLVAPLDTLRPDSTARGRGLDDYADLDLQLDANLETKMERSRNERCASSQLFDPGLTCQSAFQPSINFQFTVKTGGVVADRVHVDVDYDSQREFDASNNIALRYEGKASEVIQRVEVGNVSFTPPPSRFITAGIPSGNYGLQAIGRVGPVRFRSIFAQQKGNVVKDRVFTVGDRTLQTVEQDVEDYRVESRRFFFTIDPRRLSGWPNVDVLDAARLGALAAGLPAAYRPTKVFLYRVLRTTQAPPNPNGPRFVARGARLPNAGVPYELLREGVDYYLDPSQLWFALVRPLSLDERLVVAYNVALPGAAVNPATGGTPVLEHVAGREEIANVVWDKDVQPGDSAFFQEIRSVYRVGGEEVRRNSVNAKLVAGASGDLEKPPSGGADTFLQLFGLAQRTNASSFDAENRLWPRATDPNRALGGGGQRLIRDQFVVLPSLRPFARDGLARLAGDPSNDSLYATPSEDLVTVRRPQTVYRLRLRYQSEGGAEAGGLALGGVQIRPGSERLLLDGVPLERGRDYEVDYELGAVRFTRPDTLFPSPRQVTVQYEENSLFASAPTSIFGLASSIPFEAGELAFTAISQRQRTTFNRPPLGFEPASSLVAGVSGRFAWDAPPVTRLVSKIPFVGATGPSRITLAGEMATSRPQANAAGQAYVESFEGEGGTAVPLTDPQWYYASQPPVSPAVERLAGADARALDDTLRAAQMAWQNNGFTVGPDGASRTVLFTPEDIDPLLRTVGNGPSSFERVLWLTLYPLGVGSLAHGADSTRWTIPNTPRGGRRWRSVRTVLSPTGVDLSRVEQVEFWTLVRVDPAEARKNPILLLDFGDVSENSLAFAPTRLDVAGADSLFSGRRTAGLDSLDSERDPLTLAFDAQVNDRGLPGDRAPRLTVRDEGGTRDTLDVPVCRNVRGLQRLGDTRADCTVGNDRLDEEDIDKDRALNLRADQRAGESWRRYAVDLSRPERWRQGGCTRVADRLPGQEDARLCWVQVRLPFRAPDDSLGAPSLRRVRALRVTVLSPDPQAVGDSDFVRVPIARLRLVGAPWLKRADTPVPGAAGDRGAPGGFVVASVIGTQDRDSLRGVAYESPPGVVDEPDQRQTGLETTRIQVNERSLRLLAGAGRDFGLYRRAEAFVRFPEGQKSFMNYRELRVWARGVGDGWGQDGELQFFVKIGRDADNFYLYRTPVNGGAGQAAWLPEVRVRFERLYALRSRVQNAYLQGGQRVQGCDATERALIDSSVAPLGRAPGSVWAACQDGYMVYTADPNLSPPNLAAVQELSVGFVRVAEGRGTSPILPADTLELWVDDVRLTSVQNTPGYAGELALGLQAGDVAAVRVSAIKRDANFRQLAEQPTFEDQGGLNLAADLHLERLLPKALGYALPLTITHSRQASRPDFLAGSDLRGDGIAGLRTPEASATSVALHVRRVAPLANPLVGPLLNNLALTGSYATADTRTEYQAGQSGNLTVGLDYQLAASSRTRAIPSWLDWVVGALLPSSLEASGAVKGFRAARLRWNPVGLRVTSRLARASDTRQSFLKPAFALDDAPRTVDGLNHVWQNGVSLEMRPVSPLSLTWGVNSMRDLRHYESLADTAGPTDVAGLAERERRRVLGLDVGLERERQMQSAVSLAPFAASWFRPRVDVGTSFALLRDPNARSAARAADTTGAFLLPRRLNNARNLSASATVDVPRLLAGRVGGWWLGLARAVQPLDVSVSRNLLSARDNAGFDPGLDYQLALGGLRSFLGDGARRASSAALVDQVSAGGTVRLPLGASVATRFQSGQTTNWARRLSTGRFGRVDGAQTSFPDVQLRWNWQPAGPLAPLVASVGANARFLRTEQRSVAPSEAAGDAAQVTTALVRSWPVTGSVTWAFVEGLSTSAGYTVTRREDAGPGRALEGTTRDATLTVGKPFKLPRRWNTVGDLLNTSVSLQRSGTQAFVLGDALGNALGLATRGRQSDTGRRSLSLNADTQLAENLSFSLQGAHVVTFDQNFNRRITQTVFSTAFHMTFAQ